MYVEEIRVIEIELEKEMEGEGYGQQEFGLWIERKQNWLVFLVLEIVMRTCSVFCMVFGGERNGFMIF